MKIAKRYIPPLVLLMVSLAGTAYAAGIMFTQTGPALGLEGIASQCKSLTPNQPGVLPGSQGFVAFDCSPNEFGTQAPAFSTAATVVMKPSYAFPTGYSGCTGINQSVNPNPAFYSGDICVIRINPGEDFVSGATTCDNFISNSGQSFAIPSTPPVTLTGPNSWYYCIEYTAASLASSSLPNGGLGSFSVMWSS